MGGIDTPPQVECLGILRIAVGQFIAVGQGFFQLVFCQVDTRTAGIGVIGFRLKTNGLVTICQGFFKIIVVGEGRSSVPKGLRVLRVKLNGLAVLGNCFVQVALVVIDEPPCDECLGVVRI